MQLNKIAISFTNNYINTELCTDGTHYGILVYADDIILNRRYIGKIKKQAFRKFWATVHLIYRHGE